MRARGLSHLREREVVAFLALAFLAASVEWTGSIANVGFALYFLVHPLLASHQDGIKLPFKKYLCAPQLRLVVGAGITTAAAFCAYILHFSLVLDIPTMLKTLTASATGRAQGTLLTLLRGYHSSYYLLLPFVGAVIIAALAVLAIKYKRLPKDTAVFALLFLTVFPLTENLLMLGHATLYTYDRMKFTIPLVISFLTAFCVLRTAFHRLKKFILPFCAATLMVISCFYFRHFMQHNPFGGLTYRSQANYTATYAFAEHVRSEYSHENSVLECAYTVRGHTTLLYARNMYEEQRLNRYSNSSVWGSCSRYLVRLLLTPGQWQKDHIELAYVLDTELNTAWLELYDSQAQQTIQRENQLITLPNEDAGFPRGINTDNNQLLFDNNPVFAAMLENADILQVEDTLLYVSNVTYAQEGIVVTVLPSQHLASFASPSWVEVNFQS